MTLLRPSRVAVGLVLFGAAFEPAEAAPAYSFCYPVSPIGARGSAGRIECPVQPGESVDPGLHYYNARAFLKLSPLGYHLGDDWNGNGGGSTDIGAPVYAIAEGQVIYVRDLGSGEEHPWGKVVVILHNLPEGGVVYSLYAHLDDYRVPEFCDFLSAPECVVNEGEKIGWIGDANGYYHGLERCGSTIDGGCAHLHFEMRKRFDLDRIPGRGYVDDLTDPLIEANYYDPTDFIESRRVQLCPASSTASGVAVAAACAPGTAPSVVSESASGLTEASGTLNMTVDPNGLSTTAWFQWGATSGVTSATPILGAGSGTSPVALSATLSSLDCDRTYYFEARAQNGAGPSSGSILSFRTDPCTTSGTETIELIQNGDFSADSASWSVEGNFQADRRFSNYHNGPGYAHLSLDGSPGNNLNGTIYQQVTIPADATSAVLRYWLSITTSEPGGSAPEDFLNATLQNSSGGFLAHLDIRSNQDASGGYFLRQSNLVNFIGQTIRLHFLGTTNATDPTVFRIDDVSLLVEVPTGGAPDVSTLPADQVTASTARLNMSMNPNGPETTVWFDFEANDSTPNTDTEHLSIGGGTEAETVSYTASGLQCDTLYYFRANATNSKGSDQGSVLSVRTQTCPGAPPSVDTDPADSITGTSARLTAEVNPNELATTAWFEWGTTSSLGATTPQQSIGSGTEFVPLAQALANLRCGTTYYFTARAQNNLGTNSGAIDTFTTTACDTPTNTPPTITLTEPDGTADAADTSYLIQWIDADPDDNAIIALYYSSNSTCSSPVLIAANIPEDDPANSLLWNTSAVAAGTYYILASIDDGTNPAVLACSGGPVTVDHPAAAVFLDGFESGDTSRWSRTVPPIAATLFSDSFSDGAIDPEKWTWGGNSVREADGYLYVDVTVTDAGGRARTVPITPDPSKSVTISRRARVYAANNYFDGRFRIEAVGHPEHAFGVSYANYYYTGAGECVTVGFSIFRNNANSHVCADQGVNTSPLIPPIWGTWFDERIEYNPISGDLAYYIDGVLRISYNVGPLPAAASSISLYFAPWGWYTGHYQHMDTIRVDQ